MNKSDVVSYIKESIEDLYTEEEVEEVSTSSAAGHFDTPKAFVKKDLSPKKKKRVSEGTYRDYKMDKTRTNARKIGENIKRVNALVREIDRLIRHSSRLKTETNTNSNDLWKRTQSRLHKVEGQLVALTNKVRQMRS